MCSFLKFQPPSGSKIQTAIRSGVGPKTLMPPSAPSCSAWMMPTKRSLCRSSSPRQQLQSRLLICSPCLNAPFARKNRLRNSKTPLIQCRHVAVFVPQARFSTLFNSVLLIFTDRVEQPRFGSSDPVRFRALLCVCCS